MGRRAPDTVHMATALNDGLAILTEDTDFAKLVAEAARQGDEAPAVMLIGLHGMGRRRRVERIMRAVEEIGSQPDSGSIHVIEATRIRTRLLRRDFA